MRAWAAAPRATRAPALTRRSLRSADYMIDNILLLLKGTLVNPDVDPRRLVDRCHPLGRFDDATLKSICACACGAAPARCCVR